MEIYKIFSIKWWCLNKPLIGIVKNYEIFIVKNFIINFVQVSQRFNFINIFKCIFFFNNPTILCHPKQWTKSLLVIGFLYFLNILTQVHEIWCLTVDLSIVKWTDWDGPETNWPRETKNFLAHSKILSPLI